MTNTQDDQTVSNGAGADEAPASDSGTDAETGEQPVDELTALREQAETYQKNWQRATADLANYKRRTQQEKAETMRLAQATLAINLLPVFDDMDRAVEAIDSTLAGLNWVQGMQAIHRKFQSVLEGMQVAEIEAHGQPFDPAFHEAIGRQPGEEDHVLQVVQKGYQLGDRVVRPAMVIVGNGEPPETT